MLLITGRFGNLMNGNVSLEENMNDQRSAPSPTDAGERFYVCQLLPPRLSFFQDMTTDEAAVMQAHAAYWAERLRLGCAIVFGPVADPSGLAVIRVKSDEDMRALEASDPAIWSGRGFRYEVLPMLRAVFRA